MTIAATDNDATTELYWEARGSGPAVLLIAATPGDAGALTGVADELARHHLVITYDRRGTSRSRQSTPFTQTSMAEQADDAADVLSRVGVRSAVVFGTSNGAAVALELALRHPARVSRVILHEMPLMSVLEDPAPVASAIGSLIGAAMEKGGPRSALEAFLRFAWGDDVVENMSPELWERMLANSDMVFSVELPAFQAYRPDAEELSRCRVPAAVLVGEDQPLPFFHEAAGWLAGHLGTTVASAPGGHGAPFTAPRQLAARIREITEGEVG